MPLDVIPAAVTTVGSMPGTSVREAVAMVVDTCAVDGVPHLPELPARGPGSDLVGRTTGLLASVAPDLATETTPTGWRFADAPGRESRRARSWLGEDLDAWEEALAEYDAYRKREKEAAHMRHAYNAAYGMHVEATPRMREEAVRAERARWAERRAALMRAMDAHDFVTLLAAEMNGRRVLHSETIAALLAAHPEIMAGMVLPALDGSQSRMSSLVLGSSRETTGRGSISTDHVGLSLSPGPGSFEDRK